MSEVEKLMDNGNFEEAIRVADDLLRINPYDMEALIQKGVIQRKRKQFESSLQIFDQAVNLLPKNADVHSERGVTLFHLGKLNEALEALNQAQDLEPNNPYRYSSRAYIKDALKDIDGAIADYEKAIELDPQDAIARNNLGMLEEKKGNLSKAKKHFKVSEELEGIDLEKVMDQVKIQDGKNILKTEEAEEFVQEEKPTFWSVIKGIFTNKKAFNDFINFIKNGFKSR